MRGTNRTAQRIIATSVGLAFVLAVVWSLNSKAGAMAVSEAARGRPALAATPARVSAPLKPDWVEALLDARATTLWSMLEAHDLEQVPQPASVLLVAGQRVSAPLKPDWVEALLDARATALRSMLEARDLESSR